MKNIGIQTFGFSQEAYDALQIAQPAVLLILDPDAGAVQRYREVAPNTTFVGRLVGPSDELPLTADGGIELAEMCLRKRDETSIQWWLGANERGMKTVQEARALNAFEANFAGRLQTNGAKPVVCNTATGVPRVPSDGNAEAVWEAFGNALRAASALGFHEYWYLDTSDDVLDDGWNAYRYQKWYPLLPSFAQQMPALVSELGVAGHLPRKGNGGWRGKVPARRYEQLLLRYSGYMPANFAATIFHVGPSPDPKWDTYDIRGEMLDWLVDQWAISADFAWGRSEEENEIAVLERILERRLNVFENLIGMFPDVENAWWFKSQVKGDITHYVIHHTATGRYISTRRIYEDHLERFGGIGYHFLVYLFDPIKVRMVRSPLQWGAHVKDGNDGKIGIAVVDNAEGQRYQGELRERLMEALLGLVGGLDDWIGHEPLIAGHNDLAPVGYTECPGDGLELLLPDLKRRRVGKPDCEELWEENAQLRGKLSRAWLLFDDVEKAAGEGKSVAGG